MKDGVLKHQLGYNELFLLKRPKFGLERNAFREQSVPELIWDPELFSELLSCVAFECILCTMASNFLNESCQKKHIMCLVILVEVLVLRQI